MTITIKNRWWEVYPQVHRIYEDGNLVAKADRIAFANDSETFSITDTNGKELATLKVKLRKDMPVILGEKAFTLLLGKEKIEGKFENLDGHTSFKIGKAKYTIRWPEPKHPKENLQVIELANGKTVRAKAIMDIRSTWERDVHIDKSFKTARIPLALLLARKVGFVGSEYVHYF